jgi:hypothetical protein
MSAKTIQTMILTATFAISLGIIALKNNSVSGFTLRGMAPFAPQNLETVSADDEVDIPNYIHKSPYGIWSFEID